MQKFIDSLILFLAIVAVSLFLGALTYTGIKADHNVSIIIMGWIATMCFFSVGLYQTFTD